MPTGRPLLRNAPLHACFASRTQLDRRICSHERSDAASEPATPRCSRPALAIWSGGQILWRFTANALGGTCRLRAGTEQAPGRTRSPVHRAYCGGRVDPALGWAGQVLGASRGRQRSGIAQEISIGCPPFRAAAIRAVRRCPAATPKVFLRHGARPPDRGQWAIALTQCPET